MTQDVEQMIIAHHQFYPMKYVPHNSASNTNEDQKKFLPHLLQVSWPKDMLKIKELNNSGLIK